MTEKLDLHGYTVMDAWRCFDQWINEKQKNPLIKKVVIVTGDGVIKQEFERWCMDMSFVRQVELHRSGGAFVVYFYKKRREF